jgi:hypothetical protein
MSVYPPLIFARRLIRSTRCLCVCYLLVLISMRFVPYQRKVGDQFLPGLLIENRGNRLIHFIRFKVSENLYILKNLELYFLSHTDSS